MKSWLQTSSDCEAVTRSSNFWATMRDDLDAGDFWADQIKQYRTDAQERLQLALQNLPLPGAFREASIALRSLIRAKRKEKQSYEEELAFLYWLAAIRSFSIPYSVKLKEPGFNVIELIPGKVIHNLSFEYRILGYEKLELLKTTDKKWIMEIWGEPEQHSTLYELHRSIWDMYEDKLLSIRSIQKQKFDLAIKSLIQGKD